MGNVPAKRMPEVVGYALLKPVCTDHSTVVLSITTA
jgi:hypothetical protein